LRILPYKGDRDYQYYLDGLKVNGKRKRLSFRPVTNNFRTVVSGLFEYAVKRALISRNPMRAVERVKAVDKPPGIFTPEELKKLLEAAHGDILPALAIQAFAGVRTAEILRMEWSRDRSRWRLYQRTCHKIENGSAPLGPDCGKSCRMASPLLLTNRANLAQKGESLSCCDP
jgi:integrase